MGKVRTIWLAAVAAGLLAALLPGAGATASSKRAAAVAQFIRLAWSIAAGAPVEQPSVVACRYARVCALPAH
jgi:hypothetical protein